MKTIDNFINPPEFKYSFPHPKEDILFFDIETTGFSPKTSSIYMIGVMYFDTLENSWHLKQFFADDYKSEEQILVSFLNILKNYKYLYHFNGKTFDIPYILSKCKKHGIKPDHHCYDIFNDTNNKYSFDILSLIRPLQKLLSIEKANQSSLEQWLGIMREDKYDGKELIPVYSEYMQKKLVEPEKVPELENLLLMHNHDDIAQMLNVCSILSYKDVFSDENDITITDITPYSNDFINICFMHNITVPKKIDIKRNFPKSRSDMQNSTRVNTENNESADMTNIAEAAQSTSDTAISDIPDAMLFLEKNTGILRVPILHGILKHFYANYKDYYYIEEKDMAVHKSLCTPADKNSRKKASASTCYIKNEGIFLPSLTLRHQDDVNLQFYITYRDKICFYMIPDEIADKENPFWHNYVTLQLSAII